MSAAATPKNLGNKGPKLRDKNVKVPRSSKLPSSKSGGAERSKPKSNKKEASCSVQVTATEPETEQMLDTNESGEPFGENDFLGSRSLSMDEFMRASNMVETNLEKLSATLERSLMISSDELVSGVVLRHSKERSFSVPRERTSDDQDLSRKVSLATMEHVYALRVRAEQENDSEIPNVTSLKDQGSEETLPPPRDPRRFTSPDPHDDQTATGGDRVEALEAQTQTLQTLETQTQTLQTELDLANSKLSEANETIERVETKNRSLESAVKELEEALSATEKLNATSQEKYNSQKTELQSAHELIKETLQQVWDLKAAQIAAQKAANVRPRIDL
mmetsp:Transcript_52548/g.67368  ORF Transcript_52548/g.67368 Transcript_52548/m.67368 type:complete len:333 (+) Transcript_52548:17-1015(+)